MKRREDLWKTIPSGRPRAGLALADAFSIDHLAIRHQALANQDPSASAWLTACPAWPNKRMNDVAFRTAFQIRNLVPVVAPRSWCHCGKEMDTLSSHMFVCANQSTRSKIRNTMHRKLCEAVKRISIPYFKRANMEPINGEPACADYLPLKRGGRLEDLREGPQEWKMIWQGAEQTSDLLGEETLSWIVLQLHH